MTQASVLSFLLGLVDIARQVDNPWHKFGLLKHQRCNKMENLKLECLSCQNALSCLLWIAHLGMNLLAIAFIASCMLAATLVVMLFLLKIDP
jgi:hypothetical protein